MVQQLENEQNGNQSESDENRREQLQEKENFFDMVKRFFMEHEGLKDHAHKCLSDLQQLQIYFQGCSNGAKMSSAMRMRSKQSLSGCYF